MHSSIASQKPMEHQAGCDILLVLFIVDLLTRLLWPDRGIVAVLIGDFANRREVVKDLRQQIISCEACLIERIECGF